MLNIYLLTLGGIALAQIAPGPNLLAVAGAALGQGFRAAAFVALGVATAIFVWVTLAAFGLSTLLALYPSVLVVLKLLGGLYLCFLALKALWAAWQGKTSAFRANVADWSPWSAWRRGVLVNLTNPKSALMWGAITTFLFGSGLSPLQVLGFAPLGFLSALVVYGAYAILFSTSQVKRIYSRFSRIIEALFGAAFGAIGGSLLADGLAKITR